MKVEVLCKGGFALHLVQDLRTNWICQISMRLKLGCPSVNYRKIWVLEGVRTVTRDSAYHPRTLITRFSTRSWWGPDLLPGNLVLRIWARGLPTPGLYLNPPSLRLIACCPHWALRLIGSPRWALSLTLFQRMCIWKKVLLILMPNRILLL